MSPEDQGAGSGGARPAADPLAHLRENARQFGDTARGYAMSRTHTEGGTRHLLIERMQPVMDETLLDVACGAGGMTLAVAPYVSQAIGLDPAPEMLHALRLGARRAEIANVTPLIGDAHRLPFRDRAVQLVTVRMAPHHFHDPALAVREMARVLGKGGRLGIADGTVPEDAELDAFINRLDILHDPTTVRNYSAREWRGFYEGAGLRVDSVEEEAFDLAEGRLLSEWVGRSMGSSVVLDECRRMLLGAPPAIRRALRVQPEGGDVRFDLPKIVIVGKRAG
ncbi:MAG: methyltransferase domain-containing protein [Candidatus Eisenbacteria bacterium]